VTESDIHHFAAKAKMASISREFFIFYFDRLSASCLGGFLLMREQKETVSRLLEGKDVLAVLPTGFGKSLIYIVSFWRRKWLKAPLAVLIFQLKFYS